MKIGLIDVDGHNFPNIPLMKISAWHKAQGDRVEWHVDDLLHHYDVVYMSKIFSDAYTKDLPDPVNADLIVRGGEWILHRNRGRERSFSHGTKHSSQARSGTYVPRLLHLSAV